MAIDFEPEVQIDFEPEAQESLPETGALDVIGREMFSSVGPLIGGAIGGRVGFVAGGGPASPVTATIGTFLGGASGGVAGDIAQRKVMETVAPEFAERLETYRRVGQEQHPYAAALGRFIAALGAFQFAPGATIQGVRALPAIARGTATEAEKQAAALGGLQIGVGTAGGAAIPLALQQRLPTGGELLEAGVQAALLGQPRIPGLRIPTGQPRQPITQEVPRAVQIGSAEEILRSLPQESAEGAGQVPAQEGAGGVPPGVLPEGQQPEVLLEAGKEPTVGETPPPVTEAPVSGEQPAAGAEGAQPESPQPVKSITEVGITPLTPDRIVEVITGEPLPADQRIGVVPPGTEAFQSVLTKVKTFFSRKGKEVVPEVIIDEKNVLPRLQSWENDKIISSTPEGIGRIRGFGKLFDPRASAVTDAEKGIIANAKERGVGESMGALWAETNRGRVPFQADEAGQITLANGEKGFMSDVVEAEMAKPGSQPITSEQQAWVRDVWGPLNYDIRKMLAAEKVKGFEVGEGEVIDPFKPYFPRIAIGKRNVAVPERVRTGGAVGGKQFFQKNRLYESEAEGAGTTIYEPDPVKRVATLISRAYRAVADTRLAKDPSLGGRDLSEGPPLFQKEGEVHQPAFRGKVFPIATANKLNQFYGETGYDWVRKFSAVNDAMKSAQLSLDMAAPLIQGLPTLFNNPKAWAKASGNSVFALFDRNQLQKVLQQPEVAQAASELVQLGEPLVKLQDFMAGSAPEQFAVRAPKAVGKAIESTGIPLASKAVGKAVAFPGVAIEATGRSFGAFMDVAKIMNWMAVREMTPRSEWPRMAELIGNLSGSSRMETIGISPSRALLERLIFLAPSYYRTAPALVATALSGGVTGKVARRSLARFGMGVLFTSVAGMIGVGLSQDEIRERLDPSKGKFLKVPMKVGDKNIEVGLGHLFTSLARLVGDTVEDANSDNPAQVEPWKRWLRTHSGPAVATLQDIATEEDFSGKPITATEAILKRITPISVQQANEPEATAGQRVVDAAFSFFGLNAFSQSVREAFFRERDKMAQARFKKNYEALPLREQVIIHRQLDKDKRFAKPPSTAMAREMAFQNDVARQERITKGLNEPIRDQLSQLGLHVTGYEPIITVASTPLPLTRKQSERYENLIIEEYNRSLARVPFDRLANVPVERRQVLLNNFMIKAKARARTRLLRDINAPE